MPFYEDLSEENIRELVEAYRVDPLQALLEVMMRKMVFVVERNGQPLAITGIDEEGCMWSLFSKSMKTLLSFITTSMTRLLVRYGLKTK